MTVPVQDTFNESVANGVTTTFPYSFKLLSADDLVVTVDDVQVTSGFSVTGIGEDSGGNIVFDTAPANGKTVLRKRVLSATRATDYQENGDLPASTVDNDFDRIWMFLQQLAHDLVRAIKLPFTTTTDQTITQAAADRANKALVFDDSGNLTLQAYSSDTEAAIAAGASADAAAAAQTAAETAQTAAEAAEEQALVNAGLTPGRLVDIQIFATSGTWTKPSGLTAEAIVIVEAVGGGGGGGGAKASAGNLSFGNSGGSGQYVKATISASSLGATETVTVGAAGAAGDATPSNGTNGGSTTFSSDLTVYGGNGGATYPSGTTVLVSSDSRGALAIPGRWTVLSSIAPMRNGGFRFSGTLGYVPPGAASPFGAGGTSATLTGTTGANGGSVEAGQYGSGGGGSISADTSGYSGGAAGGGLVIVYTYN